jgi:hypothetical protein
MYLYWQRRVYTHSWEPGGDPPYSYSVSVAETVREAGAKRPHRRILAYLGSVNPPRQERGVYPEHDWQNNWSPCRLRCLFWERAEASLARAVADGTLTEEQRDTIIAQLAEAIPPPADGHRHDDGRYWYHKGFGAWVACEIKPVRPPDHVQAATARYDAL